MSARIRNILKLLLYCGLLFFIRCDDAEEKEIYLEGEPIPGIEIFFPLGYFTPDPMMPKISPDGKKLLFTGPTGIPEWKGLWVMDLVSQEKTLLHPDGRNADWAPDSEWIVFNIGTQIFKMKIDGTGCSQLTFPTEVEAEGSTYISSSFFPDWNVANLIAFYMSIDYRTNKDGTRIITDTGEELLTGIEVSQPDWHPEGEKIIGIKGISANSIETQFLIYNTTTNALVQLLTVIKDRFNQFPEFSHDGKKISFSNDIGIYLMGCDGSNVKRIIPSHLYGDQRKENPKLYSFVPSWHPDGEHIIYEHFKITKSDKTARGRRVEGIIQFYKVNALKALEVSNLK